MSRKAKYTKEQKLEIVKRYLSRDWSTISLAREIGAHKSVVARWALAYQYNGEDAFNPKPTNSAYSKQYKIKAVEDYFKIGSSNVISAKYYYNNERFQAGLKNMTPVEYRSHA